MNLPRIPLFDWLLENLPKTKYDLANSSITGVTFTEFKELSGFKIPENFNLGKNDPFGAEPLREALANIYHCGTNNIVTSTGGSEANFILYLSLLKPDDEIIVEQPGYSPLWIVPEFLGIKVKFWHRNFDNGFKLNIESLKDIITKKTKLIVITNLHNPSGVLTEPKTIHALAEIAADNGAYLLIDEIFLDVANLPQESAVGLDSVIVTSSVSKVYGIGGLRSGWIISNEELTKRCLQAKWYGSVASSYISELFTAAILKNGREELIKKYKEIEKTNLPIMQEWIENNNDILEWIPPDGSVLCFPKYNIKSNADSVELGKKLVQEHGILISPGKFFGTDGHFRLTFMNNPYELRTALGKISELIRSI